MPIDLARKFKPILIAVLTISDSRGRAEDTSGDILAECVANAGHQLRDRALVKGDVEVIPGFGELFRYLSYQTIGTSMAQSRACAGVASEPICSCFPALPVQSETVGTAFCSPSLIADIGPATS
jgi:molybdenum cofactor biosynthesis protein B